MDKYKETFETWDKVAKLYEDKFMDLDLYNDTYDKFCELISKTNPSILEIGCGPGNITKYLLNKRLDFKIEAIDTSPNMIVLAKINNPTASFKVMDCRAIESLTTQYDAIMSGFCLPYLSESDMIKWVKDCSDLLAKNGLLYLSFVEGESHQSHYQTGSTGNRIYFNYHSLVNLNKAFQENNFETIALFHKNYKKNDGTNEIHSIILAQKTS